MSQKFSALFLAMDETFLGFIILIYLFVLGLAGLYVLFHYCAMGIGCFRMMSRLRVRNTWMAWVPICSDFVLGDIADTYNRLYAKKRSSYSLFLMFGRIVATAAGFPVFVLTYGHNPDAEPSATFWFMVLIWLTALTVYGVLYYIALYKIYRLFAPEKSLLLFILSLFVFASVPVIFLVISSKEPCLPVATSKESGGNSLYYPRYD